MYPECEGERITEEEKEGKSVKRSVRERKREKRSETVRERCENKIEERRFSFCVFRGFC